MNRTTDNDEKESVLDTKKMEIIEDIIKCINYNEIINIYGGGGLDKDDMDIIEVYKRRFINFLINKDIDKLIEYKKIVSRITTYEELCKRKKLDFESNSLLKGIKEVLDGDMTLREKEVVIETLSVDYEYKMLENIIKNIGTNDVNYFVKRELVKEVELKLYKVFNDFIHKYSINNYELIFNCIEKNVFKESDLKAILILLIGGKESVNLSVSTIIKGTSSGIGGGGMLFIYVLI